jgi:putative membrane protein
MRINRLLKQFNWRFLLVRILVNALALAITAAVTPKIYFVDKTITNWVLMALMLGVLNALLKPVLQFLTLQFIFVTYGLVIVLVNTLLLLLLSLLFPARFAVDNVLWALVGGLVLGLVGSFLESLLGLTMPIVDDEPLELRRHVEEQARQVDWLAATRNEAEAEERAPAIEPSVSSQAPPTGEGGQGGDPDQSSQPDARAAEAAGAEPAAAEAPVAEPNAAEPAAAESAVAEAPVTEPLIPGPDEASSPPVELSAEPPGIGAMPHTGAANRENPESAPKPRAGAKEDPS